MAHGQMGWKGTHQRMGEADHFGPGKLPSGGLHWEHPLVVHSDSPQAAESQGAGRHAAAPWDDLLGAGRILHCQPRPRGAS